MKKAKQIDIKAKREIVEELYLYIDYESLLCGSLQDVSKNILNIENRLREEHAMVRQEPKKYFKFNIKVEKEWERYSEDCSIGVKTFGVRLESDEELAKRIKKNLDSAKAQKASIKIQNEKKEKEEMETYLRLQKKFGN